VLNGAATNLSTGETQYIDSIPESWKIETYGQAGALPPDHAPPPLPQKNSEGWGSFLPITDAFYEGAYEEAEKAGLKNAAKPIAIGAGFFGAGLDAATNLFSPFRAAGAAIKARIAAKGTGAASTAAKPPSPIKPYATSALAGTGDAALYNNAERLLKGEDLDFGLAEIAGGIASGLVAGKGIARREGDNFRAGNYAARNNQSVNFAQRYTGLKGKQAVQETLKRNLKKGESFEKAVERLELELDNLDDLFYNHFDEIKNQVYNVSPNEILKNLDDYVIKNTTDLGIDFTKQMSTAINANFNSFLRSVLKNRLVKNGSSEQMALDAALDMPISDVYKNLGKLTLGEVDYIKRGMQKRTSHYNRGQGTMERQGIESLVNKEGSEGILSELRNFVEANKNLSPEKKAEIIQNLEEGLEVGVADFASSLDQRFAEVLKASNIVSADEVAKYLDMNKQRSNLIGIKGLMERADEKYKLMHLNYNRPLDDVSRLQSHFAEGTGNLARGIASKGMDGSKQDNTKTYFTPPSEANYGIFEGFKQKPGLGE
jgi:hypothetical protein